MKPVLLFSFTSFNSFKPPSILFSAALILLISGKLKGQIADFSVKSTSVCSGSSVIFSDNSTGTTGSTTYFWNFGTGALPASATGIGPHTVTYSIPGASTVSLTITDGVNSNTKTKAGFITVNSLPAVTFSGLLTTQCISSANYTLNGGLPVGGTYSGTGVTGTNFNATLAGIGVHTLTYTYVDLNGCAGSATNTINVSAMPATPVVTVTDNCNGTSVLITNAPGELLWSTTEKTSSITVTSAGVYTVTTTVNGCTSLLGSGTASPKSTPERPVASVNCSQGAGKAIITVTSPTSPGLNYKLDGGLYTTVPIFNNVANGSHTITISNAPGCTITGAAFDVACGCASPATVTLSSNSGNTCSITPVTVSGNTFGGAANSVTITENGAGTVNPGSAKLSPFTFIYTPKKTDEGKIVLITVTTNDPGGSACVPSKEIYTLIVNAVPSVPGVGTITQPTCSVSTGAVVLNGLPSSGIWILTSNPAGISTTGTGTTKTISNLLPGTYTFSVTSNTGCVSGSSANVIIKPQPLIPAPPITGTITHPTCSVLTGSVVLNGLPSTGLWSIVRAPGGITTTGSGASAVISNLGPGNYRFTAINSDGCSSVASSEVVINLQPSVPLKPTIGTITLPNCSIATGGVILNGLPATGTWTLTRNPGAVVTTGTGSNITISGLPSGIYNYTVTNSDGCISALSADVIIALQPVTPAVPVVGTITMPTCTLASGSVLLTGLPSTGSWILTRNPDGIKTPGSGISVTLSGLSVGTYNFTVTSQEGCTSAASSDVIIPVQPGIPIVVITNPSAVCSPLKVKLTDPAVTAGSTPNLTYTYWTNAATTIVYNTPDSAVSGTYYIKGTSTTGCFDIKPVIVTINTLPAANAGTGGNECDLTFKFSAVASIGTGTWTKITGPGTVLFVPDANSPIATATVSEYGGYSFMWTVVSGSCTNSSAVSVNFYQQPIVNAGTGSNNCGLQFNFNASLSIGTGTWTKISGPGNAAFTPDASSIKALVMVTAFGSYSFRWTGVNGTCTNSEEISVIFIQQPPANAGTGGDECDKDFMLNAVNTSGTGSWTKSSGPGNAVFAPDNHHPDARVSVDVSGSYDFKWTVINSSCTSNDVVNVVFHDLPEINAGTDTAICKNGNIQLHAQGTGSVVWSPADAVSNPYIMDPVATPDTTTIFKVTLTDQFGCKNYDSLIVDVRKMPLAAAGPDQVLQYEVGTSLNAVLEHNYDTGVWSVISGSAEFADSTDAKTSVSGLSINENILLWKVNNGACPASYDTVVIMVHDLTIPSLITPNIDGKNDNFVIGGLTNLGKTELIIFDRRGVRVYKNGNYDNLWNGVDSEGNNLPDDTYFYVMKSENGNSVSGFIVIRR